MTMKLQILRTQVHLSVLICLNAFSVAVQGSPVLTPDFQTLVGDGSEGNRYRFNFGENEHKEMKFESHEFPWQVSLRTSLNYLHFCGGVIVDERTVLTTAACAELANSYLRTEVVAGNLNLNTSNNLGSQQIVQGGSTHLHPNYAENSDHSNDIAILKVNPAFLWTEAVAPIPTLHTSYSVSADNGIISGWGTKREEELLPQEKLQKATVKLMHSNQDCQDFVGAEDSSTVLVEDSMICITSLTSNDSLVDSCTGDQGGPLIIYADGSPVLLGLISFGIGCGRPNMPSFCTRVSPYIDFIQQYQETH